MNPIMELFIEKVRKRPCLWNMDHIAYRDNGRKDLVWERVARECGIATGKEAKTQWKKLRDSHREALRRRKTTGQPMQNLKPWKYEQAMEFVLPQTENRENFSSVCTDSSTQDSRDNITETLSPEPGTRYQREEEREKRREQIQIHRDDMRRQVIDENRVPNDALSNLFVSLCQKTRELPKSLQLRVQREIFEAVTRAEEEALSLDTINTYGISISSTSSHGNNQQECKREIL